MILQCLSVVAVGCVGTVARELDRGDPPDQVDGDPDSDERGERDWDQQQQRLRARLACGALWAAPLAFASENETIAQRSEELGLTAVK